MFKFIWLSILFLIIPELCKGQEGTKRLGLESQYGWILAHNSELKEIAQSHPISLGFSSQWMKTTPKNWKACNCFHYLGLNLSVVDFQNAPELGQAWNLSGSFEPYLFQSGKWAGSLNTGIGVSYLSRVYDPVENPRNTFFSAPISFLLFLTPKITYEMHSKLALQGSIAYNHISNGGQRQPNRGMNFPMLGLGILYYTNRAALPDYQKAAIERKWSFYADLGFNTQKTENGSRAPNFVMATAAFRRLTGIIALGGGLELSKDFSLPSATSSIGKLISGLFLENHFLFGRFDFSQRIASYLARPKGYQEEHQFYQRYLLSYNLGKNLRLGAGLKSHGHVAEYLDLRLGWNF